MRGILKDFQGELKIVKEVEDFQKLLQKFLKYFCSEDGAAFLFEIVEQFLKIDNVQDKDIIEMLAAKFLEICLLIEAELNSINDRKQIFRENLFVWDWIFLKILVDLGDTGKKTVKKIECKLEENFQGYHKDRNPNRLFSSWFILDNEDRFFYSPVFLIIIETIWLDLVKNIWIRKKKIFRP